MYFIQSNCMHLFCLPTPLLLYESFWEASMGRSHWDNVNFDMTCCCWGLQHEVFSVADVSNWLLSTLSYLKYYDLINLLSLQFKSVEGWMVSKTDYRLNRSASWISTMNVIGCSSFSFSLIHVFYWEETCCTRSH